MVIIGVVVVIDTFHCVVCLICFRYIIFTLVSLLCVTLKTSTQEEGIVLVRGLYCYDKTLETKRKLRRKGVIMP